MRGMGPLSRSYGQAARSLESSGTAGRRYVLHTAILCLGLLGAGPLASAQDQRARGVVVNRDNTPQRGCRVAFFRQQNDPQPAFEAYTDDSGSFYLSNPPPGTFWVKISLGGQYEWKNAKISGNGIDPTPLIVGW